MESKGQAVMFRVNFLNGFAQEHAMSIELSAVIKMWFSVRKGGSALLASEVKPSGATPTLC